MPKLKVNGIEVEVPAGATVLQACELAGAEIPRFCYHERLSIAGNCRMCLVEVEKSPKPVASCAMPASEGMVVHTDTGQVKKAREGVMEFLLINHPLDCPICDQAGECDLQDQAMAYGKGHNRFHENKRSVKDKDFGPLIDTAMTRCIHCTRCIRFSTQIAGVEELGAVYRGEHMEVGTYIEKAITSELSGNMIDLCPVGALTSKPYAFKARSWELRNVESIDIMDATGTNIRVDYRGKEVMRILPRLNESINEEWISDKARFAYDGLKYQRLDRPYIKSPQGRFEETTWAQTISYVKKLISSHKPSEIAIISGDLVDLETQFLIKNLANHLMIKNVSGAGNLKIDTANSFNYLFNTTIAGIEKADLCLLIGANPRFEAPMINTRLRKKFLNDAIPIASIGNINDQTYPVINLGENINILADIINEKNQFAEKLQAAKHPIVIIGENILQREDSLAIQYLLNELCKKYNIIRDDFNGYNILHRAASGVGAFSLGISSIDLNQVITAVNHGSIKLLINIGVDEIDFSAFTTNCETIYIGTHGDAGAHHANVILPGAAYTEKNATYINLEGQIQKTYFAVSPPNLAKSEWEILNLLAQEINAACVYSSINELRIEMIKNLSHFKHAEYKDFGTNGLINLTENINAKCDNFYMTNPITRASKTMAECVKLLRHTYNEAA